MSPVRDSVYVVTGGASGIGAAAVQLLVQRDSTARVAVIDSDTSRARQLGGASQGRLLLIEADITDRTVVLDAFRDIGLWAGNGVTGLICCAGIQLKQASIDLMEDEWRSVLAVHLDGTLWSCQAAARMMQSGDGGSIVTFSSVAEAFGWPARLPYAVAKAGIAAMTRTLAVEWAALGVRINAIAPGYVNTPMIAKAVASGELTEDVTALHALNRLAAPEEIAKAALFLLSEEASFITGELLFVDGGFHIRKVGW